MPRRPSTVPAYRHHKSSGQARVILNGHHFYLGPYGSEKSHERYARLIAKLDLTQPAATFSADDCPVGDISVNEVIFRYWTYAESYYRKADGTPTSEVHCIREAVRRLRKLYGRTPASEFGPKSLKAVRQHMIGEGLARGVINGYVGRIKRLFKWGVAEELVPPSIFHGLQAVTGLKRGRSEARETTAVKPVPQAMIDAVLPHVAPQVAAIIQFQLFTGCRPGEACILRGCDIDMTGRVWIFRPHEYKTEHHGLTREIFIGPRAQTIIKPWLRTELEAYLFQPCEAEENRNGKRRENRKSPMTPSQAARKRKRHPRWSAGERYDVAAYRRAIKRGCEITFGMPDELRKIPKKTPQPQKAELADQAAKWRREHCWHPHQLRHNAGTNLRKEFGVELARIILGHATAFTTEIYAEADRQQAMEVIAKVG